MATVRAQAYGQRQAKVAGLDELPDSEPDSEPQGGRFGGTEGDWAITFSMLKAIMGAGGFALPWAFARTGAVAGAITVGICAAFGVVTVGELAALKAHVEAQRGTGATYVDVARAAFGSFGAATVYALSLICSLGVTSAYLVFIATTVHSLAPVASRRLMVALTAVLVLPTTWLPDFAPLTRLAEGGTYAVLLGYGVTLGYAAFGEPVSAPQKHSHEVSGWMRSASGFGPVAFLFCVHFLLFPVMSASRAFTRGTGGFERLALLAFGAAALVNAAFGVAGLIGFKSNVSSIVINDIAGDSKCLVVTKLLLCVDLFCSYPLVLTAGQQIVEQSLLSEGFDDDEEGCAKFLGGCLPLAALPGSGMRRRVVSTGLVLITVAVGQLEDFGTIISLVGGFAQVLMAFVLPPLASLQLLRGSMTPPRLLANVVLLPLGLATAALATTGAIVSAVVGD